MICLTKIDIFALLKKNNIERIIRKHILKLKSTNIFKKLKFKKYINLYCKIHFANQNRIKIML